MSQVPQVHVHWTVYLAVALLIPTVVGVAITAGGLMTLDYAYNSIAGRGSRCRRDRHGDSPAYAGFRSSKILRAATTVARSCS